MTQAQEARGSLLERLARFPRKSRQQRLQSVAARWFRWFSKIPLPMRLPTGEWWLAENDLLSGAILYYEGYEKAECAFAERFLKPGMTVLDIGAHKGLHTLLFSRKVGRKGRVLAFEPSPRERRKLKHHLLLNRCRNTTVFECALGEMEAHATLYLVNGQDTWCNSLRPPDTSSPTVPVSVRVQRLDGVLRQSDIDRVDFVKLDVEGGELAVLKGAQALLCRRPRPLIFCEVLERRSRPWGYRASEILEYLELQDFKWFGIESGGRLVAVDSGRSVTDGNFVAVPRESLSGVSFLVSSLETDAAKSAAGQNQ